MFQMILLQIISVIHVTCFPWPTARFPGYIRWNHGRKRLIRFPARVLLCKYRSYFFSKVHSIHGYTYLEKSYGSVTLFYLWHRKSRQNSMLLRPPIGLFLPRNLRWNQLYLSCFMVSQKSARQWPSTVLVVHACSMPIYMLDIITFHACVNGSMTLCFFLVSFSLTFSDRSSWNRWPS